MPEVETQDTILAAWPLCCLPAQREPEGFTGDDVGGSQLESMEVPWLVPTEIMIQKRPPCLFTRTTAAGFACAPSSTQTCTRSKIEPSS